MRRQGPHRTSISSPPARPSVGGKGEAVSPGRRRSLGRVRRWGASPAPWRPSSEAEATQAARSNPRRQNRRVLHRHNTGASESIPWRIHPCPPRTPTSPSGARCVQDRITRSRSSLPVPVCTSATSASRCAMTSSRTSETLLPRGPSGATRLRLVRRHAALAPAWDREDCTRRRRRSQHASAGDHRPRRRLGPHRRGAGYHRQRSRRRASNRDVSKVHGIATPPLGRRIWPVMKLEASDASTAPRRRCRRAHRRPEGRTLGHRGDERCLGLLVDAAVGPREVAAGHAGDDQARRERVYAHPRRSDFRRQRLRELRDRGLSPSRTDDLRRGLSIAPDDMSMMLPTLLDHHPRGGSTETRP